MAPTLGYLRMHRDAIIRVAHEHGAEKVRVFGSVARGDADEQSDVDFLVDFAPGRSLFDQADLLLALEDVLERRVDVATEAGLRPRVRARVLQEAIAL